MILRDLTARQLADMRERCLKEWETYSVRSIGMPEQEEIWKKAFSHGFKAGLETAPHVIERDWKAVRKINENKC